MSSLNDNRRYMIDLLGNWPGTISGAGNTGVEARTLFLGLEDLQPALFGLQRDGERTRLASALDSLREREPSLLREAPGLRSGSLTRQAVRALLMDTCVQTNSNACLAVNALDDQLREGGH